MSKIELRALWFCYTSKCSSLKDKSDGASINYLRPMVEEIIDDNDNTLDQFSHFYSYFSPIFMSSM